jgi:hypothetical protein
VATKGGPRLLDANGHAPLNNVRSCLTALNNLVQRAVAELERLELFVPLLVVRHVRPIKGGVFFEPQQREQEFEVCDYGAAPLSSQP